MSVIGVDVSRVNMAVLFTVVFLTGCFTPLEGQDFPEYPFQMTIYNDGRCVGAVQQSAVSVQSFEGRVSYTHFLGNNYDEKYKSFYAYICELNDTSNGSQQDTFADTLRVALNFEGKLDVDRIESEPRTFIDGFGKAHYVYRLKKTASLVLSKYNLNPSKLISSFSPDTPSEYSLVIRSRNLTPEFPKPRKVFHCGNFALYSKSGGATLFGEADSAENGTYMIVEGVLIVGGAPCF